MTDPLSFDATRLPSPHMNQSHDAWRKTVRGFVEKEIAPRIKSGESLIIAAHGNSLRALVKILFDVSDDDIVGVEIPTGNPLLIETAKGTLEPSSARYLDAERASELPPIK